MLNSKIDTDAFGAGHLLSVQPMNDRDSTYKGWRTHGMVIFHGSKAMHTGF
jgi:hypothetical protein